MVIICRLTEPGVYTDLESPWLRDSNSRRISRCHYLYLIVSADHISIHNYSITSYPSIVILETLASPFDFVDLTSLFDACRLPDTSRLAIKMSSIFATTLENSRESIHTIFRQSSPPGAPSRHVSVYDLTISGSTCSFLSHFSSEIFKLSPYWMCTLASWLHFTLSTRYPSTADSCFVPASESLFLQVLTTSRCIQELV